MMMKPDQPEGLFNSIEFIRLEEAIRKFSEGERLIYIPNPGNWGDGLIRYGTERFLSDRNFPYVTLSLPNALEMSRSDIRALSGGNVARVLYGGNGAFHAKYRMHKRMQPLVSLTDAIFVLPSTFSVPDIKFGFRPHDVIFRRDKNYSQKFAPNSIFCHDMALSLPLIRSTPPADENIGYFFRADKESSGEMQIGKTNRDISGEGTHDTPISAFLEAISRFTEVHSDRLHVSIAAALMGRRVHLYPNSYFKNQAIYESSLKHAFPNVTFHPIATAQDQVKE